VIDKVVFGKVIGFRCVYDHVTKTVRNPNITPEFTDVRPKAIFD